MSDAGAESGSVAAPWLSGLSEAAFQRIVVTGLKQRGWRVFVVPDMRKTLAGLPDLLCLHPSRAGQMLAWELKSQRGRIRPEQHEVIAMFSTIPGVDARIVRPSDWYAMSQALGGHQGGSEAEG